MRSSSPSRTPPSSSKRRRPKSRFRCASVATGDGLSHAEIVILSADGEVLQTETLSNPDLPVDLELDALAAGRYQVAWRTDDFPSDQRTFTIPLRNSPLMVLFAPPRAENGNNGSPGALVAPPERRETPDAEPEPEQEPENRPEPENEPEPEPQEPGVLELRETKILSNSAEQAQRVQPSSRIFGRLGGARDFDWFVFELTEASPLTIWTTGETDTRCEILGTAIVRPRKMMTRAKQQLRSWLLRA